MDPVYSIFFAVKIIGMANILVLEKTRGHVRFARSPLVIRLEDSGYREALCSGWHYKLYLIRKSPIFKIYVISKIENLCN